MPKERYPWMDYVKLFASVMIMTGHYHDAAFDFCKAAPAAPGYYRLLNELLVPFQNGKFWIMVFCIVSGFLGAKKIRSLKELTIETAFRYLRFLIPLFLVNVFSFLLNRGGLYFSGQYGALMDNSWIGGHYSQVFRLKDVFVQSILFGSTMNTSLWMMRPLFAGNVLILLTEYLTRSSSPRSKQITQTAVLLLLIAASFWKTTLWYCAAVYVGFVYHDSKRAILKPKTIFLCIGIVLGVYYLPGIAAALGSDMNWIIQPKVDFVMGILFTFGFIYSNYHGKDFGKINWGTVSFWVFLIHSPLLCSLACWILLQSIPHFWVGFWMALAALAAATLLLSIVLSRTVDVWTGKCLKAAKQKLTDR